LLYFRCISCISIRYTSKGGGFSVDEALIVIPARYHSARLDGKPLREIAGEKMIQRVARIAAAVCRYYGSALGYVVATDHGAIEAFCAEKGIPSVMTSQNCANGTERCLEALKNLEKTGVTAPGLVVNLQGDNPLCPPSLIRDLIGAWRAPAPKADVYTPCVRLSWDEYERMARGKKETPFSGTTVLVDKKGCALAFSKQMLPSVRNPGEARKNMPLSPVRRHIGLYAYTPQALERYSGLTSFYEQPCLEGLEQMRFLENGLSVRVVEASWSGKKTFGGVDSEEDIKRVEEFLAEYGEPDFDADLSRNP
jgi:3-deoxy-manno-octulosonate cytidylyltransferase (CMP-KDO synthetase)